MKHVPWFIVGFAALFHTLSRAAIGRAMLGFGDELAREARGVRPIAPAQVG